MGRSSRPQRVRVVRCERLRVERTGADSTDAMLVLRRDSTIVGEESRVPLFTVECNETKNK
tara:strand:+ start:230 stop:412 length:183 start_codon:yes stop_codon:yes gene_type:complete